MSAPALIVILAVEDQPVVLIDARSDGDHERVLHWLAYSRALLSAVHQLLDLLGELLDERERRESAA